MKNLFRLFCAVLLALLMRLIYPNILFGNTENEELLRSVGNFIARGEDYIVR